MPLEGEYVLAGTGSRRLRIAAPSVRALAVARTEDAVKRRLAERGDELIVMSGMAEGFDHLLAVTALRLAVPLWCVIPNPGYGEHYWRRHSLTGRDMYAEFCRIRDAAYRVTYAAETTYVGGRHSNLVRNDLMIEDADEFLGWDIESRGTAHCVAGARLAGLHCEVLGP